MDITTIAGSRASFRGADNSQIYLLQYTDKWSPSGRR
jgi:hypothetical protein